MTKSWETKVQVKGSASESAIKKATAMLNQIGIQPNPKPVLVGKELLTLHPQSNPYVTIISHRGSALVWKTKERKKKEMPYKAGDLDAIQISPRRKTTRGKHG